MYFYVIVLGTCLCVYLWLVVYQCHKNVVEWITIPTPPKKTKKTKTSHIGDAKSVRTAFLTPVFPNIIPMRSPTKQWIAKVPLTPFRAPLKMLPMLDATPDFLIYNPDALAPVRNQGDCGSCWAFALCDVLADRIAIRTEGRFKQNLSVQQLLACFEPGGCDGGSPEEASLWASTYDYSFELDRSYPYTQTSGGFVRSQCKYPTSTHVKISPGQVFSIVTFIPETEYDVSILNQNIENMKMELYEGGPLYCAFAVYDDLFSYTGLEPYRKNKNATLIGGHAMEIIGYCLKKVDNRRGYEQGYWICRNSWGSEWPTQSALEGYFTVVMGENMCGIESRCGIAEPELFIDRPLPPRPIDLVRITDIRDYLD